MNVYETFDPIVIDDFVPSWYQDAIEKMFNQTPLYYSDHSNHDRDMSIPVYGLKENVQARHSGGLAAWTFTQGQVFDEKGQAMITPMMYRLAEEIGPFELIRARLAMNLSDGVGGVHQQHTDQDTINTVLLYYVNDSDGDTVLYKERADPLRGRIESYPKSFHVDMCVTPKKGRAVIFDGLQLHSSSSPKNFLKRQIININVIRHADMARQEYVLKNRQV